MQHSLTFGPFLLVVQIENNGDMPATIGGSLFASMENIYVFGGVDTNGRYVSSTRKCAIVGPFPGNICDWEPVSPILSSPPPLPRAQQVSLPLHPDKIIPH